MTASASHPSAQSKPKKVSWAAFEAKYLTREDAWKYEWVDGIVEKSKRTMHEEHFNILANLRSFFISLLTSGKASGLLEEGIDIFFQERVHRRPDLVYFTEAQRISMAHGNREIPEFVIEIISSNDQMNLVHKKMQHYHAANVKVVWHIFPELEEVHVYHGNQMTICSGEILCSAVEVIPGFELPAAAIFAIPEGQG